MLGYLYRKRFGSKVDWANGKEGDRVGAGPSRETGCGRQQPTWRRQVRVWRRFKTMTRFIWSGQWLVMTCGNSNEPRGFICGGKFFWLNEQMLAPSDGLKFHRLQIICYFSCFFVPGKIVWVSNSENSQQLLVLASEDYSWCVFSFNKTESHSYCILRYSQFNTFSAKFLCLC